MEPIILYRTFDPNSKRGHQYYKTEEEATAKARALSFEEPEIFSVDKVTSKLDIRQTIIDVFLDNDYFWQMIEVLTYWENGERYGKSSGESPTT